MGDEELYSIALTKIKGIGNIGAYNLIKSLGSAKAVFDNRLNISDVLGVSSKHLEEALNSHEALKIAENEINFIEKNKISCLTLKSENYPSRLRKCDDAPIVLFYRGNCDLNSLHMISVVGTRNISSYGNVICTRFVEELSEMVPDCVIVSGLAYGVDILAHRKALHHGLPTIAVLAHGFDRIYPSTHRKTAIDMMSNGGLLTEFISGTRPEKHNFIKRNRIVAGMSDAVVIIQSAIKGGALITADIADSYGCECLAFPGGVNEEYSKGCNKLIRDNKAVLVTSAEDVVSSLGWEKKEVKKEAQGELFPEISEEERMVINILLKNPEGMQINKIVVDADMPVNVISAILFELEMKGVVISLVGGVFKLL
ncbi:DNA-processing protein DprA [Phocaeicola paurosaccharolyticus]|uniref:DNA-processing protein DprA n=1 Tax=Phocaeicola paurosaccharolyticus TaxID=732242 RepID=UPI0004697EE3|nr:DNA-processing protein DprA [Phocaeicola paurosaccharolyticus]